VAYRRTIGQQRHDLATARAYEEHVASALGVPVICRFDSPTDLDIYVPGHDFYVEIKEKNQHYTPRWHLLDDVPERDLFISDELTIRRACEKYPRAFFLIRDNVGLDDMPRLYLIPIWDLICIDRKRVDRAHKGKWILNLAPLLRIPTEADIVETANALLDDRSWLRSECLGGLAVAQV